ncbi:MAG: tetratricopeptide repeat protein [bacterium]|nr:tetratricopeptide repeat protein [bacterium]
MKNNKILVYLIIVILIGGVGYYIYNKEVKISEKSNQNIENEQKDPFADLVIPVDIDEATKTVMQTHIDNTKEMYNEKPDIWETWIAIGNLKAMLGDYEGAIDAYRESISLQSNNILGYRNIAEVYKNNLHDYEKAIEYYRLAIELAPGDPEIYIALALIEEYQLKDLVSAEETYLNGLRATGNNFEILNRVLYFYKNNNNPEKANEIQNKINKLYPDSAAAQ